MQRLQCILETFIYGVGSSTQEPNPLDGNFVPLPEWAYQYGTWHPHAKSLNIHSLPLKSDDFHSGLELIRDKLVRKKMSPFLELFTDVLIEKVAIDLNPNTIQRRRPRREKLQEVEEDILRGTHLRGYQLEHFTAGVYCGWLLNEMEFIYKRHLRAADPSNCIQSVLSRLSNEIDNATACHQLLQSQREALNYRLVADMYRGSMFGRLQLICCIVEYLISHLQHPEEVRRHYTCGALSWHYGWFKAPSRVSRLAYDIFITRL